MRPIKSGIIAGMPLMAEADRKRLRQVLAAALEGEVRLALRVHEADCETCARTGEILGEIASLSDRLTLDVGGGNGPLPRIDFHGRARGEVRFFGLPSGYELPAFIDSIVDVSLGRTTLSAEARARLGRLGTRVHLQVFTTPT